MGRCNKFRWTPHTGHISKYADAQTRFVIGVQTQGPLAIVKNYRLLSQQRRLNLGSGVTFMCKALAGAARREEPKLPAQSQ
jgi:hypothetical protein